MNRQLTIFFILLSAPTSSSLANSWQVKKEINPVSNIASYYAISPYSKPMSSLQFPYSDVKSWVNVGCDSEKNTWAYISHTKSNFTGGKWSNSSKVHYNVRFKFDDKNKLKFSLREKGNSLFVYTDKSAFIDNLKSATHMTTGIEWYKQGDVYFKYSMKGSSQAIDSIMMKCGIKREDQISCNDIGNSYSQLDIDMMFYQKKTMSLKKYQELKACKI